MYRPTMASRTSQPGHHMQCPIWGGGWSGTPAQKQLRAATWLWGGQGQTLRRPEEGTVRVGLGLEANHLSPLLCQYPKTW